MAEPRKQTCTMHMYLKKMIDGDIRSGTGARRLAGQWNNEMINELVVSVLNNDYIPPVILKEEEKSFLWIIDGLQRSVSLMLFRYGNYKITSSVDKSFITYIKEVKDENGGIVCKESSFDIRNKTYEKLPCELKKRFDAYQIEEVIYQECDTQRISRLIKIYNNYTSMNAAQKALTCIDNFAEDIREITELDFFNKYGIYNENQRTKGVLEKIVVEAVMCMFYPEFWNKQTKQICRHLNQNASRREFLHFKNNIRRLEKVITKDVKEIYAGKDSFLWFALFDRFADRGMPDIRFAEFVTEFKNGLRYKKVDGKLFDSVDKHKGEKDKEVVISRLNILEALMNGYLSDAAEYSTDMNLLDFVRESVGYYITGEDIEQYSEVLYDLTLNVDNSSRLLDIQNRFSLIALVAYSFENDIDLDDWIVRYFDKHSSYISNQTENYISMKKDVDNYFGITV